MITIYTDGSCENASSKTGGWAAILIDQHGYEKEISGAVEMTTSNRMELMAILQALFVFSKPQKVKIITDSTYVVNTVNKGSLNRFIKEEDFSRPNFELWKMLHNLTKIHEIEFEWVKGHSGNEYNERCDKLAVSAMKELKNKIQREKGKSLFDLASPEKESLSLSECIFIPEENKSTSVSTEVYKEILAKRKENEVPVPNKKRKKKKGKSNKKYYYAVARGRQKGVYYTWTDCQKQINKYPGGRFKKFDTEEEALLFIKKNG